MRRLSISIVFLLLCALRTSATDHFVSLTSPNSAPPYTNWDTAAHVIQDAVDAADPGDTVIVTNGVYNTGGHVVFTITNRVAITKPLTVQSVNGPTVTIIEGYQVPGTTNDTGAVRCVYMTNNTTLIGFTLTHGATGPDSAFDNVGGGVLCQNFTNSVLSNCIIIGNSAASAGGGISLGTINDCLIASNTAFFVGGGSWYSTLNRCVVKGNDAMIYGAGAVGNWGTDPNHYWTTVNDSTLIGNSTPGSGGGADNEFLNNCLLIGNQALEGGGAFGCRLYDCTVASNSATTGAGVGSSTVINSIIYHNNGPDTDNYIFGSSSCTPSPIFGDGNITAEPLFANPAAGDFHLQSNSPCINSGNNALLTFTNVDQGYWTLTFTNDLEGKPRLAGGTVDMGAYEFQGNVRYVSLSSTNPVLPYSDWTIAATNIQDAIDAANAGDTVLVTNGLYNTGGRVTDGTLTNRVVIDKALTVQSVNGPDLTIIEGYQLPGITNGPGAVRCVSMTTNTALIGFTITHGATDTNLDNDSLAGGVRCLSMTDSVLSNCVIINNSADEAGGISWGTLNNCVIANNSSGELAGGADFSTLNHCLITNNYSSSLYGVGGLWGNTGGGVPLNGQPPATVNYCIISGNSSAGSFGCASGYILNHCLIMGNKGNGAIGCRLFNCIVVSNSVGIEACQVLNSIIYYNDTNFTDQSHICYSCTTPRPAFYPGNITNEPVFVDPAHGDFHLQPNSPCINSGYNGFLTITNNEYDITNIFNVTLITNDFDGNPRLVGGTVDLGAYEFQSPASQISYAWLLQHSFPLDGSVDSGDPDGDGMNNYQEWRAGTDPADSTSLLQMLPLMLSVSGATITWQSQTNIAYCVQRAPDPGAPFSTIQSNIVGTTGTISYTDTNSVGNSSFFYRVGVQ